MEPSLGCGAEVWRAMLEVLGVAFPLCSVGGGGGGGGCRIPASCPLLDRAFSCTQRDIIVRLILIMHSVCVLSLELVLMSKILHNASVVSNISQGAVITLMSGN